MLQIHGLGQYVADVNSDNKLLTETTGVVQIEAQIHDGESGIPAFSRPLDVSMDYRTRVGVDNIAFSDTFSPVIAGVNLNKYKVIAATMTCVQANGRLQLNSGASAATGVYTMVQSTDNFALYLSYSTYFEVELALSQLPQPGNELIFGLGTAVTNADPTSGVYFKVTSAGQIMGVVNFNDEAAGQMIPLEGFTITPGEFKHYLIIIHNDRTEFWVDDVCYLAVETAHAAGSPIQSMHAPILFRNFNKTSTPLAQIMMINSVMVSTGDLLQVKPWQYIMASSGNGAYQKQDGTTGGNNTYMVNNTAPSEITTLNNTGLSNAAYVFLGGDFLMTALAGAETDGVVFSYAVIAPSVTQPGKQLVVNRIKIDAVSIGAAVAGTPTCIEWSVGVNGSAVSLATADAAVNTTTGIRAFRRLPIGIQSWVVGDPDGKAAQVLDILFDTPIVVDAGYYLDIIVKFFRGTATPSQKIRGTCLIVGSFE